MARRAEVLCVSAVATVGIAALLWPTDSMTMWMGSLTVGFVLISIPFAVGRTGEHRCFWLSFLLVASVYLSTTNSRTSFVACSVRVYKNRIATDELLDSLASAIHGSSLTKIPAGLGGGMFNVADDDPFDFGDSASTEPTTDFDLSATPPEFSHDNFILNGHSLFSLIFGWLSGHLSRRRRAATKQA